MTIKRIEAPVLLENRRAMLHSIGNKLAQKLLEDEQVKKAVCKYGAQFCKLELSASSRAARSLSEAVVVNLPYIALGKLLGLGGPGPALKGRWEFLKAAAISLSCFVYNFIVGIVLVFARCCSASYAESLKRHWIHACYSFGAFFAGIAGAISPELVFRSASHLLFEKSLDKVREIAINKLVSVFQTSTLEGMIKNVLNSPLGDPLARFLEKVEERLGNFSEKESEEQIVLFLNNMLNEHLSEASDYLIENVLKFLKEVKLEEGFRGDPSILEQMLREVLEEKVGSPLKERMGLCLLSLAQQFIYLVGNLSFKEEEFVRSEAVLLKRVLLEKLNVCLDAGTKEAVGFLQSTKMFACQTEEEKIGILKQNTSEIKARILEAFHPLVQEAGFLLTKIVFAKDSETCALIAASCKKLIFSLFEVFLENISKVKKGANWLSSRYRHSFVELLPFYMNAAAPVIRKTSL